MSRKDKLLGHDPLAWLREERTEVPPPESSDDECGSQTKAVSHTADERDHGHAQLSLDGSLQVMDVAAVKAQLETLLQHHTDLTLRADEEMLIDGAGAQLLLALACHARQNGLSVRWESVPTCVSEAARLLGAPQILLAD